MTLLCTVVPADGARGKPDLKVTVVGSGPATVARGGSFAATATVKNLGGTRAPRTTTGFYLSRDRSWSRTDTLVGTKLTGAVRPRRTRAVAATVRVPAAQATGRYYLLVCADLRKAVKERSEANNCTASGVTTRITPPAPGSDIFPMTPNPLDVDYTVDPSRTTSANVIGSIGATLTATGADGTTYKLQIPANAIDNQVRVSLTPVARWRTCRCRTASERSRSCPTASPSGSQRR